MSDGDVTYTGRANTTSVLRLGFSLNRKVSTMSGVSVGSGAVVVLIMDLISDSVDFPWWAYVLLIVFGSSFSYYSSER